MAVDGALPVLTSETVAVSLEALEQLQQLGHNPAQFFMEALAESNPVLCAQIVAFASCQPTRDMADLVVAASVSVFALLAEQAAADDADDAERDM